MSIQPLPTSFCPLPPAPEEGWAANVHIAYDTLQDIYATALRFLRLNDADPLRLALHIETISSSAIPILQAMEGETDASAMLPTPWLHEAASLFGVLVVGLRAAEIGCKEREDTAVTIPEPVTTIRTGRPGRPRKNIDLTFLQEAVAPSRQIKLTELAKLVHVHQSTLRRFMKQHDIERKYSLTTDEELDTIVKAFKQRRPESGLRYIIGFLRRGGHRIQRRRVIMSLRRVDGLGRVLREHVAIRRRKYHVRRPNALWHVDGHHKLIRWGLVIHGIVDGYCRTITGLRVSTNNRPTTVLAVFLDAVTEYDMPSRMRGDRGGENVDVATYMILKKGPKRASFMWGSSTRNTRIERMWVEVGSQFARRWRAFFTRLEDLHHLDVEKPSHLWLLHTLFLDQLNADCREFRLDWNSHPIAGQDTNDKSPQDLRLVGQLKHGVYHDECDGVHPDTINLYYGTHGREIHRRPGQTGAGHPSDEEDSDGADTGDETDTGDGTDTGPRIMRRIADDQSRHIRHDGLPVPAHYSPFEDTGDSMEGKFFSVLTDVVHDRIIPDGFGILPDEWDDGVYPSIELLKIGRRGKTIQISLANRIWRDRATLWCQALSVLMLFTI